MKGKTTKLFLSSIIVISAIIILLAVLPVYAGNTNFVIEDGILKVYNGNERDVVIPAGVKEIADYAFRDCTSMFSVTIPGTVRNIGSNAFENCSGLSEITIPGSVRNCGSGVFLDCTGLLSVRFEDGLDQIGQFMFGNCSSLEEVYISSTIYSIYTCSFSDCESLQRFVVDPDSKFYEADDGILYWKGKSGLYRYPQGRIDSDFRVPRGVKKIVNQAFNDCIYLEEVVLPESLEEIDELAFWGCTGIESIDIPAKVNSIGINSFSGCSSLEEYEVDRLNRVFSSRDGVLFKNDEEYLFRCPEGMKGDYEIPEGTVTVGECAFLRCEYITGITIPDTVREICESAFDQCQRLVNIDIPVTVTKIHETVLEGLSAEELPEADNIAPGEEVSYVNKYYRQILENNQQAVKRWLNAGDYTDADYDTTIFNLSDKITAQAETDYQKLKLIYTWVADNIYYDRDKYNEIVSPEGKDSSRKVIIVMGLSTDFEEFATTAEEPLSNREQLADILEKERGVCSDYAALTEALIRVQGIPCMVVNGYALGVDTAGDWEEYNVNETVGNHSWNEAFVDGHWVTMDITWGSGNKYENGKYKKEGNTNSEYFDISAKVLAVTHKILSRGNTQESNIPSEWGQDEIKKALKLGIIPFDLQGEYREEITRLDFCRLVVRFIEVTKKMDMDEYLLSVGKSRNPKIFSDTSDSEVLAATAVNIVNGKGVGLFCPEGKITRQEAAAMLERTAGILGIKRITGLSVEFKDSATIASWASPAVRFVSSMIDGTSGKSIMGGTGNDYFSPIGTYTREQAYMTVLRLYNIHGVDK